MRDYAILFLVAISFLIAFLGVLALLCAIGSRIYMPRTPEDEDRILRYSYFLSFFAVSGTLTFMIVQGWIPNPIDIRDVDLEHLPENILVCPDGGKPTLDGRC